MIGDIIQEEKNKISQLLFDISKTIDNLQFMSIPDYQTSDLLKKKWEVRFKKLFADMDNFERNEFPIVVLGRWNSGKSTLINAILGNEILPSANKEMTSILTKIYYGNIEDAIVRFDEKKYQHILLSQMENYVNFRGDDYSEKIKQIDVILDNMFLKSGLCILDTPGLSSINELNNKITYDIIPKANSILLTFSGLDVGGEENLRLIEQVLSLNFDNLYNVVFVITKRDIISAEESLEAEESLKELIKIAQQRLGLPQKINFHICMVSSYMELKYRQYLDGNISENQIINDSKLRLSSIDQIQKIHQESNFEEFYKILDNSILNSENKKNITHRLFIMIQNVLTELLEDYRDTYNNLSKSNNSSLEQIMVLLQHRVDLEKKIWEEGQKEINDFYKKITALRDDCIRNKDTVINEIYIELCKYIKDTPYEVISKNKFFELNKEIKLISTKLFMEWMRNISNKFNVELKNTIDKIADINEQNSKEIGEVFMKEDHDVSLISYGVQMKSNLAISNFMLSFAASIPLGLALFNFGNGVMPGVGGIVGSIVGGLLGFATSMVGLSNSEKRKEHLQKSLHKHLFSEEWKYSSVLRQLHSEYRGIGELLEQYLNTSLKRVTEEKNAIIEDYKKTKERYEEIEGKLVVDINSIKELIPSVNLAFSQYLKI